MATFDESVKRFIEEQERDEKVADVDRRVVLEEKYLQ